KRFPDKDSVLRFFKKDGPLVNTRGADPEEANAAAFCHVSTKRSIIAPDLNPGCPETMAGAEENGSGGCGGAAVRELSHVMNLVVRRAALYASMLSHRREMEALKSQGIRVNTGQHTEGQLWTNKDVDMDAETELPSVEEIESELLPKDYTTTEELATALKRWYFVGTVIRDFYGSEKANSIKWELAKSKKAEVDWAIPSILRHFQEPTLFVYGNG
ncbi:hypothetical protein BGX20_001896, partial [Mortierella sp. AD010]